MTGTPEEDLLGWLEREEEVIGFNEMQRGLTGDYEEARERFFGQITGDLTENQFDSLKAASRLRYEELPQIGVSFGRVEQAWGYQETFRDVITGRFVKAEDAFSLLATIR